MIPPPIPGEPAGYRVRVNGHLDEHWSAWFGDLTLIRESDGTTTLSGVASDQAALHGLLTKVRDLGMTLLAVEPTHPSGNDAKTVTEQPGPEGKVSTSSTRRDEMGANRRTHGDSLKEPGARR